MAVAHLQRWAGRGNAGATPLTEPIAVLRFGQVGRDAR